MKSIPLRKATAPLADYARDLDAEPVILTVRGKPVAALIAIDDVGVMTSSLARKQRFMAIIEESRAKLRAEGGISSDEMRRRLGIKPRRRQTRRAVG